MVNPLTCPEHGDVEDGGASTGHEEEIGAQDDSGGERPREQTQRIRKAVANLAVRLSGLGRSGDDEFRRRRRRRWRSTDGEKDDDEGARGSYRGGESTEK